MFPRDEDSLWVHNHPHPLPPHPSQRLHQSSWWGTEAPPYPREREDEEEDDAEGWGPKPELFVRWQKLSNTTIAISHSRSLSDYTDHYTAAVVCVGVCLCGEGGFFMGGVVGGGAQYCRRSWTWPQAAPPHIRRSLKAADHYHSAYITDNSWSSKESQVHKTVYKRYCLIVYTGVFWIRGGKRMESLCLRRSSLFFQRSQSWVNRIDFYLHWWLLNKQVPWPHTTSWRLYNKSLLFSLFWLRHI